MTGTILWRKGTVKKIRRLKEVLKFKLYGGGGSLWLEKVSVSLFLSFVLGLS
jgi:hypothetical protein